MFYTVFTFRAQVGKEEAILDLFATWQRERLPEVSGFISSELLRDITDLRSFMSIVCFASVEAARAIANQPAQDAWYRKLVALTEAEPVFHDLISAMHISG